MALTQLHQLSTALLRWIPYSAALLVLLTAGCQSVDIKAPFPWEKDSSTKQPDKIMAVWTDAVKTEPGKPGERGFGGRVFFYDNQGKTMKVKGQVSIYLFDDDRSLDEAQVPEKKFVFPADSLDMRYSKCSLGHSYNFWVPVGPLQGPNRKLSLVTKIELESGGALVSGVTRKILPGNGFTSTSETASTQPPRGQATSSSTEVSPQPKRSESPVVQVGYEESVSPNQSISARTMAAETIQLTPSFTERLRRLADEQQQDQPARNSATEAAPPALKSGGPEAMPPLPASEAPSPAPKETSPDLVNPGRAANSPAAHSGPEISRVQTQRSAQPDGMLLRYQPHPGGWLSSLPRTPRSGFQTSRPKIELTSPQQTRRAAVTLQAQAEKLTPEAAHVAYSADAGGLAD